MSVRSWLDRRLSSPEQLVKRGHAGFKDLIESVGFEYGKASASNLEEVLQIDRLTALGSFREAPSEFHKSLIVKSARESVLQASMVLSGLSFYDLEKKVKERDWSKVSKKSDEDSALAVDHKFHTENFPVHPEYSKALASNEFMKTHKLDRGLGISAKMVHSVPSASGEDVYMAKPYHKKIESATRSWVKHPILGWASMATKALFNAGGIGHLAEDVSAHEHNGVPMTVHGFAPDHTMSGDATTHRFSATLKHPVDPVQTHQIAVMDYLANNSDRHYGNLMVKNYSNPKGFHDLLAIDHERNFQYARPVSKTDAETPWSYKDNSPALRAASNSGEKYWSSHDDLVDWWSSHGQKIRDEMENQLKGIKDENVRKHVRDNFVSRWTKMNDWARDMRQDPDHDDVSTPKSLHYRFQQATMIPMDQPRITSKQLLSLPKNNKDALSSISDIINRKDRLTFRQRFLLKNAIDKIFERVMPEEAGQILRSVADNPYMNTKRMRKDADLDIKNRLLRHFSQNHWAGDTPTRKYAHMASMADAIDSMPPEKRETLKMWSDYYRRLMADRASA